ncbi:MAG: glycosyl hydrolase 53 family protein [Terracidiphilus sp.]
MTLPSRRFPTLFLFVCTAALATVAGRAQQPTEPANINPINGETYYLINQRSGLQADLDGGSTTPGQPVVIESRSFTSLTQRWALTHLPGGDWAISNISDGLCLDSAVGDGSTTTVENTCSLSSATQQWTPAAASNGYCTLANRGTGLVLDVSGGASSAGASLNQTALAGAATQSQQWLLRPAFFRGVDGALLEKQEADRVSASLPWWQDAGQPSDVLAMLKSHGVNMVRVRPTSTPPYQTLTLNGSSAIPATCTGNGCYVETDAADLNLAKRAKQLGMSVELTLFYDGASSQAVPGAWQADNLTELQSAVYSYVKSEVESYRAAGVMPDMVSIGNEVDTGLFGSLASPGDSFSSFAAVEQQAMQAVLDASSDTSLGPAIPPPLRCIHITPAWNLTSFFTEAKSSSIPFDAICQSYYPFFHGPLTAAQAATSNPDNQPVEQTVLTDAANSLGVPIFLIEVGEHYEDGFDANDPWYPATVAGQRQFLIDVNGVLKNLPNHLGMGMEYWDPEGVNTAGTGGGFTNGDGSTDATYVWNGLTLFDNADTSGASQSTATNYSAILSGADALGGRLDASLSYLLINVGSGQILGTAGSAGPAGTPLGTADGDGGASLSQQWSIASNGDGYLQIANLNVNTGETAQVLDNTGSTSANSAVVLDAASSGDASQEWNLVTAGSGNYTLVNKASGLVLAATSSGAIQQQAPSASTLDWIVPASSTQLWQVVPAYITEAGSVQPPTPTYTFTASQGSITLSTGASGKLTLTVTPSGGYQGTVSLGCGSTLSGVNCSFSPTSLTLDGSNNAVTGTVTVTAPSTIASLQPLHDRPPRSTASAALCWLPAGVVLLITGVTRKRIPRRARLHRFLMLLGVLALMAGFSACGSGGSGGSTTGPQPETGTLTITAAGSTGNISQTVKIAVTVN